MGNGVHYRPTLFMKTFLLQPNASICISSKQLKSWEWCERENVCVLSKTWKKSKLVARDNMTRSYKCMIGEPFYIN